MFGSWSTKTWRYMLWELMTRKTLREWNWSERWSKTLKLTSLCLRCVTKGFKTMSKYSSSLLINTRWRTSKDFWMLTLSCWGRKPDLTYETWISWSLSTSATSDNLTAHGFWVIETTISLQRNWSQKLSCKNWPKKLKKMQLNLSRKLRSMMKRIKNQMKFDRLKKWFRRHSTKI